MICMRAGRELIRSCLHPNRQQTRIYSASLVGDVERSGASQIAQDLLGHSYVCGPWIRYEPGALINCKATVPTSEAD